LMVRCGGFKRDGTPCAVSVEEEQGYCWWHSPENAEERRRAASRGGKAKANPLTRELHALLEDLMGRVVSGDLVAYRGAVACQLVNARIRLIETEREVKEQEELIERLERLERNRGGGGAGRWAN
jgi:hypothetical protein